jgi:hypothetical protein
VKSLLLSVGRKIGSGAMLAARVGGHCAWYVAYQVDQTITKRGPGP